MKSITQTTRRALAVLLLLPLSGCYRATFFENPTAVRGNEHERWTDFFIFGLVGTQDFSIKEFCPSGEVAQVRTGANFGTGIVGFLTIGIYTPRKLYVTCAATGKAARRELEIDATSSGEPVAAKIRTGNLAVPVNIQRVKSATWRLQERS
ncbi:MAG: hypothetical protein SFV15_10480 [Polyangiaceae bacterium]|nr:hypothetical protein [Polyangiaceae bacterium]